MISWAALLLWTGSRSPVPLLAVWTVIILNAAGALACALLAWGLRDTLTAFGTGFMVVNGVGALLLALGQYQGLQRSSPAGA